MKNTYETSVYIHLNIVWAVLARVLFRGIFGEIIPEMTLRPSSIMLDCMIVVFMIIGILLTCENNRNFTSVATNVLLPWCVFILHALAGKLGGRIKYVIVSAAIAIFLHLCLVMSARIKNRNRIKKMLLRRLRRVIVGSSRIIVYLTMVAVIIPLAYQSYQEHRRVETMSEVQSDMQQYTMTNYMNDLVKLEESVWETLDLQERIDVCQVIANIEGNKLGLPAELNVTSSNLTETIQGQYVDRNRQIVLDEYCLMKVSSYSTVVAVAHEVRHAYQYRMVDVYEVTKDSLNPTLQNLRMIQEIEEIAEELENYTSVSENAIKYELQLCEKDADAYGEEAAQEYRRCLQEYFELQEKHAD